MGVRGKLWPIIGCCAERRGPKAAQEQSALENE